jgi:hypothetical protein
MHGLESTQGLVYEILAMVVGEVLSSDHTVHISFHQFLHSLSAPSPVSYAGAHYLNEVDLGKAFVISWFLDVKNGNDVLVIEVS